MDTQDFLYYKDFLYKSSGLALTEAKIYLLTSRLSPVAKKHGFESLESMTTAIKASMPPDIKKDIIDAMMTNETLFFRDDRPFKYFTENVLPGVIRAREQKKALRIWSAACSTGQEPYSIAMTLCESFPQVQDWHISIFATDLSEKALAHAKTAEYNQFEIQRGMPIQMLMKYFEQDDQKWKLKDQIRNMVRFENFNLLDSMERFQTFDIIFCRNVLIYFDENTKRTILNNMVRKMAPDGFLFLGGAENMMGICDNIKIVSECPGLYTHQSDQSSSATAPTLNTGISQ